MGLSIDQLKSIKDEFQQKYIFNEPYSEYVNGCGISNLKCMRDLRKRNVDLIAGESLEDLCLSVYLIKEPPKDLKLPSEYMGVRVFYEGIGEIMAL